MPETGHTAPPADPGPPWRWSAEAIARAVAAGEVSAAEVVDACLDRTAAAEPALNAYLDLDPAGARERAAEIDRSRAAGEPPGALAGVPVALKDNLSLAGRPLTCGSRILGGYVAPFTATAALRLADAGAVVVGKANLDELGMGSSGEHSAFGPTRNPWRLDRVAGGSSSGPAAAVASGGVPLALGSDTGGSVRLPAALSGAVGVRPTRGRVSRWGLVAFSSSLDQVGPLARSVRDAALALGVIAGPDGRDSTAVQRPTEDYLAGIEGGAAGLRIGVVGEIECAPLPRVARTVWSAALERLARLGCDLVEVSVPAVESAVAAYSVLANAEASADLARFDGLRYGRRAAAGGASATATVTASRSRGFGDEVKRRVLLGTFMLSAGLAAGYYDRARAAAERLRRELEAALGEADLLVTPTTPGGAFAFGERSARPLDLYLEDVFTAPASLAGLPAVAVPSGCDGDGLPLSLQVIGPRFGEAVALRLARAFEAAGGWAERWAAGPGRDDAFAGRTEARS